LGDTNGNCNIALNPDNFADNTAANYEIVGQIATNFSSSYQGGFNDEAGMFFLPQAGGTASSYVTDGAWSSTGWRVLLVGGGSRRGALCGPWAFSADNTSSITDAVIGSLLSR
jgi:hypothetical protein